MSKFLFKPKIFSIIFSGLLLLIVLSPYLFEPLGNIFRICPCNNPPYKVENGWMCTMSMKVPTKYYIGGTYVVNCGEDFMVKVRFGLLVVTVVYVLFSLIYFSAQYLKKRKLQQIN